MDQWEARIKREKFKNINQNHKMKIREGFQNGFKPRLCIYIARSVHLG